MQIKSLQIKNYKAYGDNSDIISFNIPDNTNVCSGLTILTGPNNSGKSTAFDALLKFDENKRIIDEDKRGGNFEITIIDKELKSKILKTKESSSQIEITGESQWKKEYIEFIPSRRPWSHRFNGSLTLEQYTGHRYQQERNYNIGNELARLLDTIHRNKKKEFTAIMREVIPDFFEWHIRTDRQGDYISYSFDKIKVEHQIDLLGDGTINLFAIIAHLLDQNIEKTLIIDEPELSLHPEAQRRLFTILKERSKDKQIIIATHSPYFVDAESFYSIRKFKLDQSGPEVKIHKQDGALTTKEPAIFTFWHRDLFFTRRAIFVEGPEDYIRIKKYLIKNSKEDVNYGLFPMNGKSNGKFFENFCKNYGITASFIYDVDYIEGDLKKFFDSDVTIESKKEDKKQWYRENFEKFKDQYSESKKALMVKNVFIWSKPDITDILNEEGIPLVEKEVEECIEFICKDS